MKQKLSILYGHTQSYPGPVVCVLSALVCVNNHGHKCFAGYNFLPDMYVTHSRRSVLAPMTEQDVS